MKIAILASGQPRFCAETDAFIERLIGYDQVDWFFYLWKENSVQHVCGHNVIAPSWITVDYEWAIQKFKENLPANHNVILQLVDYDDVQKLDPVVNPAGAYKMFRGTYQANQLRLEYEKINGPYDLVIKTRIDFGLLDECNLIEVKELLDQHPNRIVTINNREWPPGGRYAINDWFAIGLPDAMNIYADALKYVHSYPVDFLPEISLAYHLEATNLEKYWGNFHGEVRYLGETIDNRYQSVFSRWA
jgi:hypothetical protein